MLPTEVVVDAGELVGGSVVLAIVCSVPDYEEMDGWKSFDIPF